MNFKTGNRVHFEWSQNTAESYERYDGVLEEQVLPALFPDMWYIRPDFSTLEYLGVDYTPEDLEPGQRFIVFEEEIALIGASDG